MTVTQDDRSTLSRRDAIRLGLGASAALAFDPMGRFARMGAGAPQARPLITRAIP